MAEENELECCDDKTRRTARRRMAWVSLIAILVVTFLACFIIGVDRLVIIKELLSWFFTVMAGVVGAYMGISSFEHLKTKSINSNERIEEVKTDKEP